MKALKPSMKEDKRYLLLQGKDLKKNVEKSILEFSGTLGLSNCGLSFIENKINSAIISINRGAIDLVKASFCVFSESIAVQKISGTLKSLRE